ncbi:MULTISPECIES: ABC transporter permease [unclassified Ensifer]|uniref:ABC transporter permease n=1 Tax=unclassified Ensifer TaxID=2633371 RepID=UPI000813D1BD|nr:MULTISPECIES: ABC transporter permease [unclassified Ensifer]OCP18578.1 capsular biosynthesis protein [Ensifer sp. LC54]OCP18600.1 capsular biosynthesis protein [Ensifer sp. LC384]
MSAVILRDVRTRFFDHGLGFLLVPLWPLGHMLILLSIYTFSGRQAPFGESLNVFFLTGLIPTMLFMYVSRFMSMSLILNKPMLAFPVVRALDIMAARAFLETIGAALTLALITIVMLLSGDDPFPFDWEQAVYAYLATLLLAVGVGTIVGVLVMVTNLVATAYALFLILLYIGSGTLFVASSLPDQIAIPLSWNPVLQAVEWMRTAYFETYSDKLISKTYLIGFGLTALFIGLALERLLRMRLLEG